MLMKISISIHTFRVEGDSKVPSTGSPLPRFQSTPSVWKVTVTICALGLNALRFQSTPSVWKVTHISDSWASSVNISIHTFRVEGDYSLLIALPAAVISIHTFRVEGDLSLRLSKPVLSQFQSTPSVWKVTGGTYLCACCRYNFNPHLPCGR